MGRPVKKQLLAQVVSVAKIGTGAEGTAVINKQKGERRYQVTVGGVTGLAVLVSKAPGTLAAGEMAVMVTDAHGTTQNVTKIFNRTVLLADGTRHAWSFAATPVAPTVQMVAAVEPTPAPVVTIGTQPANASVTHPATATFTVAATATNGGTKSYQWFAEDAAGSTFGAIPGATSASYTTAATDTTMTGKKYHCVVTATNAGGTATATSNDATLTVA